MSIPVDLAELADAASRHDFAYLVTTTEDARAHLVAVRPVVEDRTDDPSACFSDCVEVPLAGDPSS